MHEICFVIGRMRYSTTSLGGNADVLKRWGAEDPSIGGDVSQGVIEDRKDADSGKAVCEYKTPIQPCCVAEEVMASSTRELGMLLSWKLLI